MRRALRTGAGAALATIACLTVAACGGEETVVTVTGPPPTTGSTTTAQTPTTTADTTAGTTSTPATVQTTLLPPPTQPATTTDPATTTSGDEPAVDRPADFPNGGEAYILARLHPDVAPHCTREDPDSRARGSVAGLYCDLRDSLGGSIYYDLFPRRAATAAAYHRYRRANDVPLGRGECTPAESSGRRPTALPSEGTWSYTSDEATAQGRVMCFKANSRVWLVTSHDKVRVISFVSGTTRRQASDLWFGPAFPSVDPR